MGLGTSRPASASTDSEAPTSSTSEGPRGVEGRSSIQSRRTRARGLHLGSVPSERSLRDRPSGLPPIGSPAEAIGESGRCRCARIRRARSSFLRSDPEASRVTSSPAWTYSLSRFGDERGRRRTDLLVGSQERRLQPPRPARGSPDSRGSAARARLLGGGAPRLRDVEGAFPSQDEHPGGAGWRSPISPRSLQSEVQLEHVTRALPRNPSARAFVWPSISARTLAGQAADLGDPRGLELRGRERCLGRAHSPMP